MDNPDDRVIHLLYRNYRGDVSWRRVVPCGLHHGTTDYHPIPGHLLQAWDCEKQSYRTYSLGGVLHISVTEPCPSMKAALEALLL